jgi:hypothetical protein
MGSDLRSTLIVLTTLICLAACSSGGEKPSANDAGADAASESVNDNTCQGIWICVAMCSDNDQACAQMCVARGSAQAQTMYQALATCTDGLCAAGDFNCACEQRCFPDGMCLTQVDVCLAGASDELACGFCR